MYTTKKDKGPKPLVSPSILTGAVPLRSGFDLDAVHQRLGCVQRWAEVSGRGP
ncbi:MAG TPA: hypothetical protein VKY59_11350 [Spirillospora sp.]|nr:hypothetical protein [Spirillospora sp.]